MLNICTGEPAWIPSTSLLLWLDLCVLCSLFKRQNQFVWTWYFRVAYRYQIYLDPNQSFITGNRIRLHNVPRFQNPCTCSTTLAAAPGPAAATAATAASPSPRTARARALPSWTAATSTPAPAMRPPGGPTRAPTRTWCTGGRCQRCLWSEGLEDYEDRASIGLDHSSIIASILSSLNLDGFLGPRSGLTQISLDSVDRLSNFSMEVLEDDAIKVFQFRQVFGGAFLCPRQK